MAEGTQDRREGRGRLSSIDLLPEEAQPDIVWALEQLRERAMPSNAILAEFNGRLADRGIAPISKSAWGRYAVSKAIQFRRIDEKIRMSAELVAQLGVNGTDDVTVMLGELIKVAMFEALEEGQLGAKAIMELSRGLSSVVSAQKASAEHRRKLEQEVQERLNKAADAISEIGAANGTPKDMLDKVTRLLTTGQL